MLRRYFDTLIMTQTELAPVLFTLFVAVLLVGCYALAKLLVFVLTIDYPTLWESFLDALAGLRSDVSDYVNYFEDLDDE